MVKKESSEVEIIAEQQHCKTKDRKLPPLAGSSDCYSKTKPLFNERLIVLKLLVIIMIKNKSKS